LGDTESGPLLIGTAALALLAVVAICWPALVGWPIGILAAWFALNLGVRSWRLPRRWWRRSRGDDASIPPERTPPSP
jgi:cardiolipin synthase